MAAQQTNPILSPFFKILHGDSEKSTNNVKKKKTPFPLKVWKLWIFFKTVPPSLGQHLKVNQSWSLIEVGFSLQPTVQVCSRKRCQEYHTVVDNKVFINMFFLHWFYLESWHWEWIVPLCTPHIHKIDNLPSHRFWSKRIGFGFEVCEPHLMIELALNPGLYLMRKSVMAEGKT